MQVATVPHGAIAANKRLPGKKTMSMQTVSVPASPAPRSLISVARIVVMAVWLLMAAFAVAMLAVMLVVDSGGFLLRGGRPGPARTSARRAALIPTIF